MPKSPSVLYFPLMTDTTLDPRRPAERITITVAGLHCTNCALSIEKHLSKLGVDQPAVDFASGRTTFLLNEVHQLPNIIESIRRLGYSVSEQSTNAPTSRDTALYIKAAISAALTMPMLLGMVFPLGLTHDPLIQLCLITPVFVIGILHFGASGIRSLRAGVANMDVLIAAGILAAFTASVITMTFGLSHDLLFFEAVGSIVTFVLVGHLLEEIAVKKTTTAIESLSYLQPQEVQRVIGLGTDAETQETIPLSQLRVGDLMRVNTGDRVPTDGTIVSGEGSFDEAMLTGESLPVDHGTGERVTGGTILARGTVVVRATAVGEDTTLAGIIKLVREAQQRKPSIQRVADSISAIFVPTILTIACLTFILSVTFFDIPIPTATVRALAIVVVACPCAMGLATPSAIMVALGRAARSGILIRGGDTLERLDRVRHIAFDKTGTLTKGHIHARDLRLFGDTTAHEARDILVSLQRSSSHPIARAVARFFNGSNASFIPLTSVVETKGVGISATAPDGAIYACGGRALASQLNVATGDDLILTRNGVIIASLSLDDTVRPEARRVVEELHALNCSISLISGDTKERCRSAATEVGITTIHSQQLPVEKLSLLRQIQKDAPAAYVGDGINDAPTLTEAAVGVSLSTGSDIAMQSAQVLLTGDSIANLPAAIRLSRLTVRTIKQNLLWALIYNVITVPLAASGYISPIVGALLMSGSDLVIIGNSLRIRWLRISSDT